MPDLSTTVDLIFRGVDNASDTINIVSRNLDGFADQAQKVTAPVASITTTALKAEAAIVGFATVLGGIALNSALAYEDVLVDLQKVYSDQNVSIDEFQARVRELANEMGESGTQTLQYGTDFIKAGNDVETALDLVRLAIETQQASGVDYATAVDFIISAQKNFSLSTEDLRQALDFANTASDTSAITFGQLIQAFQGGAGAAGTLGISVNEYIAQLVPGIERTREAEEVSRALRGVYVSLVRPTEEQADVLSKLGVELVDSAGNTTLAKDRAEQFFSAIQDTTGAQKEYTLAVIGGKDQVSRLSAVVEGAETTQRLLNIATEDYLTVAGEFERQAASTRFAIDQLFNSLGGLSTVIGQQTQGDVQDLANALNTLVLTISDLIRQGALEDVFSAIGDELGALEEIARAVAENLPEALEGVDFTRLADSIGLLGEAVRGFFGVDLTTVEGLRSAIQGISDGIAGLTEFSAGAITTIGDFVEQLIALARAGNESGINLELLGNAFGGLTAIDAALPKLQTLLTALVAISGAKALGGLISLLPSAASGIAAIGANAATAGPLIGVAGLAGAVAAAAYAAGNFIADATGLSEAIGKYDSEIIEAIDSTGRFSDAVDESGRSTDQQIRQFEQLAQEYENLKNANTDVSTEVVNLAAAFEETGKATNLTVDELDELNQQLEINRQIQEVVNNTVRDFPAAIRPANDAVRDYVREIDEQGNLTIRAAEAGEQLGEVLYENNQTLEDGRTVVNRFYGELENIPVAAKTAGDETKTLEERLLEAAEAGTVAKDKIFELQVELEKARLEANVEFDIAKLEQDTIRIQSQIQGVVDLAQIKATIDIAEIEAGVEKSRLLFESLDLTTEVVGSNIDSLITAIAGLDEADKFSRDKLDIFRDALDRELTILELNAETQRKVADAQIAELEARAQRLRSGEALITVNGDGLEPELRLVMSRLLEITQIEANADGQAFLLGI